MATRPLPELDEYRFGPYIGELHEFFATSHVPFGSPEDLPALVAHLTEPGSFSDDLSSLVRSIILREGGAMPHAQLLEILAFAIAGPEMKHSPQTYQDPLRQLLGFVGGIMRRPWNLPPNSPGEIVPFPSEVSAKTKEDASTNHVALEPDAISDDPVATPGDIQQAISPEPVQFSHRSALGAALAEKRIEPPAAHTPPDPTQIPFAEEPSVPAASAHPAISSNRRRLLPPLVAAAAAALVLTAALVWHAHQTPETFHIQPVPTATSAPVAQQTQSAVHPSMPKPSAALTSAPRQRTVSPSSHRESQPSRDSIILQSASATASDPMNQTYESSAPAAAPQEASIPAAPIVRRPAYRDSDASIVGDSRPILQTRPSARIPQTSRFSVSSGVMAANLISAPDPSYPTLARITGVQGQVILQAVVAKDGSVSSTHVLRGNRLLRGAAQDAVRRWRYRPYRIDGRPVDVATIITVDFHHPS